MRKYLLILLLLSSPAITNATIRYRVLNKQVAAMASGSSYNLDVDFDGVNEYSFFYYNPSNVFEIGCIPSVNATSNYLTTSSGSVVLLDKGQGLGLSSNVWGNGQSYINTTGNVDKYVMIRFLINGSVHYGWVSIFKGASTLYINSVAYEDEADKTLLPGHGMPAAGINTSNNTNPFLCSLSKHMLSLSGVTAGSTVAVDVIDFKGKVVLRETFKGNGTREIDLNDGLYITRCAILESGERLGISKTFLMK